VSVSPETQIGSTPEDSEKKEEALLPAIIPPGSIEDIESKVKALALSPVGSENLEMAEALKTLGETITTDDSPLTQKETTADTEAEEDKIESPEIAPGESEEPEDGIDIKDIKEAVRSLDLTSPGPAPTEPVETDETRRDPKDAGETEEITHAPSSSLPASQEREQITQELEELEQLRSREKQVEDQARLNAQKAEELERKEKELEQRKKEILDFEKSTIEKMKQAKEMMKEERGRLREREKELARQDEKMAREEPLKEPEKDEHVREESTVDIEETEVVVEEHARETEEKRVPTPLAREFRSKEAENLFMEGNRFFRERLYESALSFYRKALQLEPDRAEIWNNMGVAFDEMGMSIKARQCYDEAIKLGEGYCDAYLNKGYNLLKSNLYESALTVFGKVFEIDPTVEEAREFHEFCKIKLGRL